MKQIYIQLAIVLAFAAPSTTTYAQTINAGSLANFGIDGDIRSGERLLGAFPAASTDDWFAGASGIGVIDTTGTASIKTMLSTGGNTSFTKGMAYQRYTMQGGKLFLDGRYIRDNMGLSGSVKDSTVFTNGSKNGMSPDMWGTNPGGSSVTDKTDIIDGYAHMRREGQIITGPNPDHLILIMGASTAATSGSRFIDLELYKTRVTYNPATGTFTNVGPTATGGHTAWTFNANGTIQQVGDMDVTFDFSSSSITDIGVYLWVAKTVVQNIVPAGFDFVGITEFYGDGQNATYGYAKIKAKNGASLPVWGAVNTSAINSPFWGTTSKELGASGVNYYSMQYAPGQMAEVGLNLTALGIDLAFSSTNDPCSAPFSRMMIKSRVSSSFTSALSDFTCPSDFMDAPQVSPYAASPEILKCGVPTVTLKPQTITPGAIYSWSTSNGNIVGNSNVAVITVNKPGKYFMQTSASVGCTNLIDSVIVIADFNKPVATANRQGTITSNTTATLIGGDPVASNYPTPFGASTGLQWSWTGPLGYTSSQQNNVINVEGTYQLILTELRNGCKDTAVVYVPAALVLPVKLVDFSGSYVNGSNRLKWTSASEVNLNVYAVERSSDGVNFKKIGDQKAVGNSTSNTDYSFTDSKLVAGTLFYRLKMINDDGSYAYSKVISLNSEVKEVNFYMVYPNPFGNTLQVKVESGKTEHALIRLVNNNGVTVKLFSSSLQPGVNTITIEDVARLSNGIYYFEITTSTGSSRTKVVKQ